MVADYFAQIEINANGQSFANATGNASCVIDAQPVWIGTGLEQCQSGHRMKQVKDENPNSSSYNQTQWIDTGEDATCAPQQDGISFNNYTSYIVYITFTNVNTNQSSPVQVDSQGGNYLLLSPGVYNISISSPDNSGRVLVNGCSFTYSGYVPITTSNVTISSNCNITIQNNTQ